MVDQAVVEGLLRRVGGVVDERLQGGLAEAPAGGHVSRDLVVVVIEQPIELGLLFGGDLGFAQDVAGGFEGGDLDDVGVDAQLGQGVFEEDSFAAQPQDVEGAPGRGDDTIGGGGHVVMSQVQVGGEDDDLFAGGAQAQHGPAQILQGGQARAEAGEDEQHAAHVAGFGDAAQAAVECLQAERRRWQGQEALVEAARWGVALRQGAAQGHDYVIEAGAAQAAQPVAQANHEAAALVTQGAQAPAGELCQPGRAFRLVGTCVRGAHRLSFCVWGNDRDDWAVEQGCCGDLRGGLALLYWWPDN